MYHGEFGSMEGKSTCLSKSVDCDLTFDCVAFSPGSSSMLGLLFEVRRVLSGIRPVDL